MPVVLMNFDHYNDWVVHFIQSDYGAIIGAKTRFFTFTTLDDLRTFVIRYPLEGARASRSSTATSGNGACSIYFNLTAAIRQTQEIKIERAHTENVSTA